LAGAAHLLKTNNNTTSLFLHTNHQHISILMIFSFTHKSLTLPVLKR